MGRLMRGVRKLLVSGVGLVVLLASTATALALWSARATTTTGSILVGEVSFQARGQTGTTIPQYSLHGEEVQLTLPGSEIVKVLDQIAVDPDPVIWRFWVEGYAQGYTGMSFDVAVISQNADDGTVYDVTSGVALPKTVLAFTTMRVYPGSSTGDCSAVPEFGTGSGAGGSSGSGTDGSGGSGGPGSGGSGGPGSGDPGSGSGDPESGDPGVPGGSGGPGSRSGDPESGDPGDPGSGSGESDDPESGDPGDPSGPGGPGNPGSGGSTAPAYDPNKNIYLFTGADHVLQEPGAYAGSPTSQLWCVAMDFNKAPDGYYANEVQAIGTGEDATTHAATSFSALNRWDAIVAFRPALDPLGMYVNRVEASGTAEDGTTSSAYNIFQAVIRPDPKHEPSVTIQLTPKVTTPTP